MVTADELFACPQGVACLDDEEPFASEGMPALTPRAAEALAARVNARAHAGPQAGSLVASRVASLAATNVFPQAVSHVYFTSGSSGAPKACVGTHACLARYAVGKNATFGLSSVDCAFVASAHTFDPSLGDIAAAFACGASVALAPRALVLGGQGALLSGRQQERQRRTSRYSIATASPSALSTRRAQWSGAQRSRERSVPASAGRTRSCAL